MTHSVVIHALIVSWYPKRRPSYLIGNIMLDLGPQCSIGVVKVVKEAHEASCVIKKALKKPFDPHTRWFNCLEEMKMMWEFGVLEPLGMAL